MTRRTLTTLAVAVAAVLSASAQGQTAEDLVAKNIEAKGGLARIKAVQTIRQSSRMVMQGAEGQVLVLARRPNHTRQEVTVGGQKMVMAFDGVVAWMLRPEIGRPINVVGPQAQMVSEQSVFDGPLIDYKARGGTLALIGLETLDGTPVQHLQLTTPAGLIHHVYLDAATGLEKRIVIQQGPLRVQQEISDFRDVDGIKVPFKIRMVVNGAVQSEMLVDKVEFNVSLDDAVFRMPK
jgi:outer membrane lipoprotein-sorting protein